MEYRSPSVSISASIISSPRLNYLEFFHSLFFSSPPPPYLLFPRQAVAADDLPHLLFLLDLGEALHHVLQGRQVQLQLFCQMLETQEKQDVQSVKLLREASDGAAGLRSHLVIPADLHVRMFADHAVGGKQLQRETWRRSECSDEVSDRSRDRYD